MNTVVSSADLILLGVSEATIYRKTKSGEWKWQWGNPQGSRGQKRKEIFVLSLPPELQLAWVNRNQPVKEELSEEPKEKAPDKKLNALAAALARFSPPRYSLEQRQAVERRCVEMSSLCEQAETLIARLKRERRLTIPSPGSREAGPDRAYNPELVDLCNGAVSSDRTYLEMYPSADTPPSITGLLRKMREYKKDGPVAFIPQSQTLSPLIDDRFKDIPEIAIEWLRANLKNYVKGSVTLYGEKWLAWARAHNVALPFTDHRPGKPGSCYAWLYRWRKSVPAISMVLAKEGERGIENRYATISRHTDDIAAREGWCMDWRVFDVPVWRKASASRWQPRLVRLWLCTVFDLRSRAVFGFSIADKPSARGISLAYLDAVGDSEWKSEPGLEMLRGVQRGSGSFKPFVIWDNGKDFRSQAVEGKEIVVKAFDLETGLMNVLNSYGVSLAQEFKTQVRHSKAFNAKAKPVEPFHRYAIGLWEPGLPGYQGNKPSDKPHYWPAAFRIHQCFIRRKFPKSQDLKQLPPAWREVYEETRAEFGWGTPFLKEEVFKSLFTQQVIHYVHKPHGGLTSDAGEMSPIEYLNIYADTPHKITPTAQAILMMEPRELMVRDGEIAVRWGGEQFKYVEVASDLSDGTALWRLPLKSTVEFRYDPANIGRAIVLSGGGPLCWVEEKTLLGYRASQADFEAANAKKKHARRTAKEFFETRLDRPDWREEAEARRDVVPLRAVVGGEPLEEVREEGSEGVRERRAEVIVPTRFDARPPDAPRAFTPLRPVADPDIKEDDLDDLKTFEPVDGVEDEAPYLKTFDDLED